MHSQQVKTQARSVVVRSLLELVSSPSACVRFRMQLCRHTEGRMLSHTDVDTDPDSQLL